MRIFLKLNTADRAEMFAAEAEGLRLLERAGAIRVPRVLELGSTANAAFLALEWLDLAGASAVAERRLGRALAALHRTTAARHGWDRDNVIGSTAQCNEPHESWAEFYCEQRLRYQIELARRNGLTSDAGLVLSELLERVPDLLADHAPQPSLLHGDLWSGNRGALPDETPVVFDPAVYFGDRETDLAMTRLFGGFGSEFYAAYNEEWPLTTGWQRRAGLYDLYHLLNHFNLFGASYQEAVRSTASRLLREAR